MLKLRTNMHLVWFLGVLRFVSWTKAAPLERTMVDMTYVYDENVQNYPIWKKFEMRVVMNGTHESSGAWMQAEEMTSATHMGTHMDAPSHFMRGGINIDQISISDLIAPAAVINITIRALENPDAEVTIEDLQAWESITGHSLDGTVVLVNSGWGKKWNNRTAFIGTPEEDASKLHFPGFDPVASQWLVDNRHIKGVGVDTLSFDKGSSTDFMSHRILLASGVYGLENVANMDKIPIYGATLYVMPMKIGQASGAPTRIIATFPKILFG